MGAETRTPRFRQATAEDMSFLKKMCFLAFYPDRSLEASSEAYDEAAKSEPLLSPYLDGFGRAGDFGFIAVDSETGADIGAIWRRRFGEKNELSIAVDVGAQGSGVGERLMRELLAQAPEDGVTELELWVRHDNTRAQSLYQKVGFVASAELHDVYQVMTIRL
ncbi:MAG TPA: GNAT family N-acetyltransferase [Patescibacteria group bacterium]|nr:GNAT family N-acetyltransferase [Patescibacteria group bacterium]